jgi:hypothetical protein
MERIQGYLDPWDWLMWASEELNSNDLDDFANAYATPLGLASNIIFMIAKANAGKSISDGDDVFGEYRKNSTGWLKWFVRHIYIFFIPNSN